VADELSAVVVDDHPAVRAGVAYWSSSGTPPSPAGALAGDRSDHRPAL
jgi:hypothetical protein